MDEHGQIRPLRKKTFKIWSGPKLVNICYNTELV